MKKNRRKRSSLHKKLKIILAAILIIFAGAVSAVFYYGFDKDMLTKLSFYINLANPYVAIVRVPEGLRKEEIAEVLASKLNWDEKEKKAFANSDSLEGHFFPKTYMLGKNETPEQVKEKMVAEFSKATSKIIKPKKKNSEQVINEKAILTIASIIQRESNGKDMKLISGIIWNRIFKGMKLQMDATLQYAKGNEEDGWWGKVSSKDKFIESAYNTYKHAGFPPGPIANPGIAAIEAAYNPQKTDCLFYLHDRNRQVHCAKTYEEHKKNIERYY